MNRSATVHNKYYKRSRPTLSALPSPEPSRERLRVFPPFVRQPIPLLQEVDPQHPLQANWRAVSLALRVVRLDDRQQPRPRDDLLHLREKALTLGHTLLARTFRFRKTDLPLHCCG